MIKKTLSFLIAATLMGCGGGGSSSETETFTIEKVFEGTKYSCPTQSANAMCLAGDCGQCVCTVGCDANAPKVKLQIGMTPTAVRVDQPSALTFKLINNATVNQTVNFKLNYPEGPVLYHAMAFSGNCVTMALSVGGQALSATLMVPPNSTSACEFTVQKSFFSPAAPVVMTLEHSAKVELEGSLPSVTVSP